MSCQCSILRSGASIFTALWLLLGLSGLAKEEDLKLDSGPKAGEQAIPYHPLLSTDGAAGQRWCMVCTHRSKGNAMIIVFTRVRGGFVNELAVAVEGLTEKHKKLGGMITFLTTAGKTARDAEALTGEQVVYLNEAERKQWKSLREFTKAQSIANSSLNIYTTDGPMGYSLSSEAAITSSSAKVKVNVALRQKELTSGRIKEVIQDIERVFAED